MDGDTTLVQCFFGLFPIEGLGPRQDLVTEFDQLHTGGSIEQIHDLASQFDACGTGTGNHQRTVAGWVPPQLLKTLLKRLQIGECVEVQCVFAHPWNPEVVRLCTCCQHQLAVVQCLARCCGDGAGVEVDRTHAILQMTDPASLQQRCIVRCNLPSLELSAHEFVQQRNEHEAVARLNQHHRWPWMQSTDRKRR